MLEQTISDPSETSGLPHTNFLGEIPTTGVAAETTDASLPVKMSAVGDSGSAANHVLPTFAIHLHDVVVFGAESINSRATRRSCHPTLEAAAIAGFRKFLRGSHLAVTSTRDRRALASRSQACSDGLYANLAVQEPANERRHDVV